MTSYGHIEVPPHFIPPCPAGGGRGWRLAGGGGGRPAAGGQRRPGAPAGRAAPNWRRRVASWAAAGLAIFLAKGRFKKHAEI